MSRRALVAVAEAAYRLDGSERDWLGGVVTAAREALASPLPVLGYFFETTTGGGVHARDHVADDGSGGLVRAHAELHQRFSPEDFQRFYVHPPTCTTVSEAVRSADPGTVARMMPELLGRFGQSDCMGVMAREPGGSGCVLAAGLERPTRLSPPMRTRWSRVAAHLGAGLRIRRRLALEGLSPADLLHHADAVLRPDGRTLDARGEAQDPSAREALRKAARAIDAARGGLASEDPDRSLEIWRGLFAGRWSLVDCFDTDGSRYLVARRNPPGAPGPRPLSSRERQVVTYAAMGHSNKLVGYQLGLGASTVATHLARALRKLGLRSRTDLALLRGLWAGLN